MNSNDAVEQLLQSTKIVGKSFHFERINPESEDDAELVINLRNRELNNFLKSSTLTVLNQLDYFKRYKLNFLAKKEIYLKIFDYQKLKFNGVVRITELDSIKKFGWESLVLEEDASPILATDVMLSIFAIGFQHLKRDCCGPWEVSKQHKRVMMWHKKIGMAEVVNENQDYYYVQVNYENYKNYAPKWESIGIGLPSFIL
jgi:hypothetical protein